MRSVITDSIHTLFLIDLAIRTQLLSAESKDYKGEVRYKAIKADLTFRVLNIVSPLIDPADDADHRNGLVRLIDQRLGAMDALEEDYDNGQDWVVMRARAKDQLDSVADALKGVLDAAGLKLD